MRKSIKLTSAIVAIVMLMTIMAACSSKDKSSSGTQTANTSAKTSGTPEAKVNSNFNATGYPIVKDKITLNFFLAKMAVAGNLDDMQVLKDYEAKTNIHINWTAVPQENSEEKKSLLFASNQLPDAFMNALNPKDESKYGPTGQLIPLNDLIAKYAPNITKMFADHPDVKKAMTTADGNIYSLPQYAESPDHVRVPDKFYINTAWLKKLNLAMPTTIDEYYNVLKAFKTQDPNGNGKADEIPLLFYNADPSATIVDYRKMNNFFSLFSAFGITDYFMVKDGKVLAGFMQDGYKEALKFTAKLYAEKLLDNESFTMNEAQARAKGSAKDSVAGSFSKMAEFQLVGNDKIPDYDTMAPLKGPDGQQVYRVFPLPIIKSMFAITKDNKNPEATMRWIDYAYSEMGALDFATGPKDVNWKWQDETNKIFQAIDPPKGVTFAEFRHKNTLGAMAPYYRTAALKQAPTAQETRLAAQAKKFFPYAPKEIFPDIYLSTKQATSRAELAATISPYVISMMAKFISGSANIDTDWNSYLDTLKKMGMDDLLKIQQDSYDLYLKAE